MRKQLSKLQSCEVLILKLSMRNEHGIELNKNLILVTSGTRSNVSAMSSRLQDYIWPGIRENLHFIEKMSMCLFICL